MADDTSESPPHPRSHHPRAPQHDPASLRAVFFTLCAAMDAHLQDDLPGLGRCQELQVWMTNAASETDENAVQAWKHAVQLLEGILGQSLTHA